MEKQRRLLWLGGVFLIIFLGFVSHYHGSFYHAVYDHPVSIFEKLAIIIEYGFFSIIGGSLSNIYLSLVSLPNFFKEDWTDKIISLTFFSVSSVHVYLSYRLLRYMWQIEVLKWYWWGVWLVNCYLWFFMGSIIPLIMRL